MVSSLQLLCHFLCVQHGHRLSEATTRDVARLLVASLLHYAAPVRRLAKRGAQACVADSSSLAVPFITALQDYLAIAPSHPVRCWASPTSMHTKIVLQAT